MTWPRIKSSRGQIATVHERRCISCHKAAEVSRLDWIDLRQPERTLFLRAPLSKSAGGSQTCQGMVYTDSADPDYTVVSKLVASAVAKAWEYPRRDLQSLLEQPGIQTRLSPPPTPALPDETAR